MVAKVARVPARGRAGDPLSMFKGPAEDDLRRMLAGGLRHGFGRGEVVFHEGDPADRLHVITRGRFAVRASTPLGESVTLAILGPTEVFGELALLAPKARQTATILSVKAGETRSIDRDELAALRGEHPEVTELLLFIVEARVSRLTRQLLDVLYVPAEIRVLQRLLEMADVYADRDAIPLTQEALAGLAGTSRSTVNRVLRRERERGCVRLARAHVTVVDRARLERRARYDGSPVG